MLPDKIFQIAIAFGSALLVAACKSTSVESTYTPPDTRQIAFKKVLVAAVTTYNGVRRNTETAVASQLVTVQPALACDLFPDFAQLKSHDTVSTKLEEHGIDGVVTLRFLYYQRQVPATNMENQPPYRSFYEYCGYDWNNAPLDPQLFVTNAQGIEINIYGAAGNKLLWSGVTRSKDPDSAPQVMAEVSKAVRAQLEREGLIPKLEKK